MYGAEWGSVCVGEYECSVREGGWGGVNGR